MTGSPISARLRCESVGQRDRAEGVTENISTRGVYFQSDRVEIYARGKPLVALLPAGQLRIAEDGGWTDVAPGDIGIHVAPSH